jgi:hypothetical protein
VTSPIVFLDTETTGLALDDEVWDFAAVRREPDGSLFSMHTYVRHDPAKAARLPESFRDDHGARFDAARAMSPADFAGWVRPLFEGRPHLVGAVPDFDVRHLRRLLGTNGYDDPWHYHLIDVETLAVGFLAGRAYLTGERTPALPWDSDELSRALGVEPPGDGVRHTAMGDVTWSMQMFDVVTGGAL